MVKCVGLHRDIRQGKSFCQKTKKKRNHPLIHINKLVAFTNSWALPAPWLEINTCGKIVYNRITVFHIVVAGAADSLNHALISLLTYIQQLQLVHTVLYSLLVWQLGICGPCGSRIVFKTYIGVYVPGDTFRVSHSHQENISTDFSIMLFSKQCFDIRMYWVHYLKCHDSQNMWL